jgi:thioredoxin reductase/NAD-dependent dihydropyrimidine dehydrogenase PreA subunit
MQLAVLIAFLLLTAASVATAAWWSARGERRDRAKLEGAVAAGLDEPPSLHPVVDPMRCIGTGACVAACPEGGILGIVNGRAALLEPTRCIGHGACAAACPVEAIRLVFGTARRGVEIPNLTPDFQTNVRGIYIAGELGGMGLVRNAVKQGVEAVRSIARSLPRRPPLDSVFDVAIVGAGPAGLAATLAAKQAGLRYVTFEQEAIGGSVVHYPREKMVNTRPVELPGYGILPAREIRKEELLALWKEVVARTAIEIRLQERVVAISGAGEGRFEIATDRGRYEVLRAVLAIGRRGSPRKLGVPGEDSPSVSYSLLDPGEIRGQSVLVVGGGDSAVESAISLASPELANHVTLSYRREVFARASEANRRRLEEVEQARQLEVLRSSAVERIEPGRVVLRANGRPRIVRSDKVMVMIGGELPLSFLRKLGVETDVKFGTA